MWGSCRGPNIPSMVWSCWSMHDCRVNARNVMYVSSVCYCVFFWLSLFQDIPGLFNPWQFSTRNGSLCFQGQEMDHLAQMVTTLKEGWEANGFHWNESINLEQHLLAFFGGLLGSKMPPPPGWGCTSLTDLSVCIPPCYKLSSLGTSVRTDFFAGYYLEKRLQKSQDCFLTQCFWYDRVWTAVTN